ncbi:MFS transporter [Pseudonocardia acaciae]|uniref:MFS transporter n=1 Tax=Pseudonocardia acaciae TaxID=551276 RepID=UPI00048F126F|nr:MFS transporter [Pseudonocardia acaciae]
MSVVEDARGNRWWPVVGAGMAVFMAGVDTSAVAVALPAITEDLGSAVALGQWVVLGYLLPLIGLALPVGRWVDRVGRRAAFTFGAGGFAVASALVGVAPGLGWLVAARVAQGAFGAMLFSLTPVLPAVMVRPEARGRAMAVVTTVGPLGLIAGPAVGGALVGTLDWPWIFYLNVPVAAVAIAMVRVGMPDDGPLRAPRRAWLVEAGLLGSASASVLLGLSLAAADGLGWLAVVGVAALPLAAWTRLPSAGPVVALVRAPGLAGPLLALLAAMLPIGLVQFVAPFYLQGVLGEPVAVVGLTLLAFAVATAAAGPIGGVLADRWGARRTALAGAVLAALGVGLLAPLDAEWAPGDVAWRLAVLGAGAGLFNGPNLAAAMAATPPRLLATAASATSMARQLGIALGPAVATVSWALSGYTPTGMRTAVGIACATALLAVPALTARRSPTRSE